MAKKLNDDQIQRRKGKTLAAKNLSKIDLTPDALFDYALNYSHGKDVAESMFAYPTLKEASKFFKVSMRAIEETCYDHCSKGYLGLIVGFKNRVGYGSFNRSERLVEAVQD